MGFLEKCPSHSLDHKLHEDKDHLHSVHHLSPALSTGSGGLLNNKRIFVELMTSPISQTEVSSFNNKVLVILLMAMKKQRRYDKLSELFVQHLDEDV